MTAFVLDCSVTMAWCFRDEFNDYAAAVQDALQRYKAVVPGIWVCEVANVLVVGERRNRLTPNDSAIFTSLLERLPIEVVQIESATAVSQILGTGRSSNLSCYDAAYIEVALRYSIPLATLDRKVSEAATSMGIALFDPSLPVAS